MGFEDEMYEYLDDLEEREINKSYFLFERKNIISCVGVSFRTLLWNYFCWFLAGKPEMKEREIK